MIDEKKSIFELAENFGVESPFGNDWIKEDFKESGKEVPSVMYLNKSKIFPIETDILIRFQLKGTSTWYKDTEYKITLTSSNSDLNISKNSWLGENEYKLYTMVSLSKPGKVKLHIAINGVRKHTYEIEFIKSKDVFNSVTIKRLKDEYQYMSNFVNDHEPQEYGGNYCMQGADRALGKLLSNNYDFYVVERGTHKVLNSINFSGLNTYSRASQFNLKGFINSSFTIDSKYWKVDHVKRKKINEGANYSLARSYAATVQYDLIWVSTAMGIMFTEFMKQEIDSKEPGWHVYYMSIVDGFHTQILLIDNTDRENPKYEIWEDHGLSSSSGDLDDIVKGINKQASSMFTVSCLFRYKAGKTDDWDNQTFKIWKIKSK